jgi:dolichol-phosphate mannosyltransferase
LGVTGGAGVAAAALRTAAGVGVGAGLGVGVAVGVGCGRTVAATGAGVALPEAVLWAQPLASSTAGRLAMRRKAPRMAGLLSIVAPLYNEEGNVSELVRRVSAVAASIEGFDAYELVLVNDGSKDRTLALLREHAARDPHLVIVDLSRNFGHQLAATAGLDVSRGDAVVLIDADLQDPPELIPELVARWREGYDVVYAVRRKRKGESRFKLLTASVFYRTIRRLTNVDIPVDTGDFRLFSRRVIEALKSIRERHRFIRGLVSWVGYKQVAVNYDRDERFSGTTKYPFSKMLRFAIDGITSFSDVPLRAATWFGFIVSGLAFLVALVEIAIRVFSGYNLPGYTSTIFAILFLGGVQLITIGILGEYIGRIHDEVKGRPLYLLASVERGGELVPVTNAPREEILRTS